MKLRVLAIALAVLAASIGAFAASQNNDAAAFAQLKSLAGNWAAKTEKGQSRVQYEVVSGGSAVVEHFESDDLGADNAMVTVFYLDGGHLQLTHYCMAHEPAAHAGRIVRQHDWRIAVCFRECHRPCQSRSRAYAQRELPLHRRRPLRHRLAILRRWQTQIQRIRPIHSSTIGDPYAKLHAIAL